MDKPQYVNPLLQVIIERLQAAFLKSGSTTEFYELLDVPKNANTDRFARSTEEKRCYITLTRFSRSISVPLRKRKAMNLRIKEAYTVLSDPKKRKLYNQVGSGGYKFIENPEHIATTEGKKALIENFQKNNRDKFIALTIIFLILALFVLQPILICLKIDGDIDTSWISIWFPLWIFDCFLIIDGFGSLLMPSEKEVDDEGNLPPPISFEDRLGAGCMLCLYFLFVIFQVLLTSKMDGSIKRDWFVVFVPWFLWEIGRIVWLVKSSCLTVIPYPDLLQADMTRGGDEEGAGDEEEGEGFNPEINNQVNLEKLTKYYALLVTQEQEKRTLTICILRFWLAMFLAAKLDGSVDWNWGLVFFPVWLFLLFENCFACYFQVLGVSMTEGIDPAELQSNPNVEDHAKMFYSTNMAGSCVQICCSQIGLILFFVLLVCALQVTSISSFVIIIPFWPLAGIVVLLFFCFFCAVGCLDTDQLDMELEGEEDVHGASNAAAASAAAQGKEGTYVPPDPVMTTATVIVPPAAPEVVPDQISSTSPMIDPVLPDPPATSRGSEID